MAVLLLWHICLDSLLVEFLQCSLLWLFSHAVIYQASHLVLCFMFQMCHFVYKMVFKDWLTINTRSYKNCSILVSGGDSVFYIQSVSFAITLCPCRIWWSSCSWDFRGRVQTWPGGTPPWQLFLHIVKVIVRCDLLDMITKSFHLFLGIVNWITAVWQLC